MELLFDILLLVIVFQLGKAYGYFKISRLMKEVAEEQGIDLERELGLIKEQEEKKPNVYKLNVETHGDMLYLFDTEQDNFICQGKSIQELCELAKKHKNVLYAAVKYNDKIFQFKDGETTEVA
jgi:hypothetical protein